MPAGISYLAAAARISRSQEPVDAAASEIDAARAHRLPASKARSGFRDVALMRRSFLSERACALAAVLTAAAAFAGLRLAGELLLLRLLALAVALLRAGTAVGRRKLDADLVDGEA